MSTTPRYYAIKTKRRKIKTGRLLFLLALFAFLSLILFSTRFIGALNNIQDRSAWAEELPPPVGERENILIFSVTESESENGLLTAVVLAAYDTTTKNYRLLHIPAQTLLEPTGQGFMPLSGVYGTGGAQVVVDTVSNFLGLPINGYLEINEAFLPAAMDRADADLVYSQLQLSNGSAVLPLIYDDSLNGQQLLEQRRQVLAVVSAHIMEGGALGRLQRFLNLSPLIRTNLSWRQLLSSMETMADTPFQQATQLSILPGQEQVNTTGKVWLADPDAVSETLQWFISNEPGLPRNQITIEVLNGSGIQGVAGKLAQTLEDDGFTIVRIDNAERSDYEETQVISRIEDMEAARDLAVLIPNAQMLKDEQVDSDVYVTVIIGKNYRTE